MTFDPSKHGPERIQVGADGQPQLCQCFCGSVGGVNTWKVKRRTETEIELEPSINFMNHFHTPNPTGLIKIGDVDLSREVAP